MRIMYKFLVIIVLAFVLAAPLVAVAEAPPPGFDLPETGIPKTGAEILSRIQLIANWVFAIFLAISIIYIVLAAFEFVTGAGEPAKVSGARMKLIYAVVGLALALLALGIPVIVRNIIVTT